MAKNIHFIGIGGIGNSSLAQILHEKGFNISGSDLSPSDITKSLKLKGITINYEHKAANINKRHNKIIYSPAIPENNTELLEAKKLKIPCLTYPQALGEFSKDYYTIAISGTHGKSTTTAMTAKIFIDAGLDPTVVIGTKMRELKNKNYRKGDSKYLIIEACEYKKSFLNFTPNILVITNIEADHLDYYKTLANYRKAFEEMVSKVPKNGKIIIPGDGKIKKLIKSAKAEIVTAKSKIKPGIPGDFNISNASLATEVALSQNIPISRIEKSLKNYKGSWRRLQYKRKKLGKTLFIDDYAHHPTEIKAVLKAARLLKPRRLFAIFEPHRFSRVQSLCDEFACCFDLVDELIVTDIYSACENKVDGIDTEFLLSQIKKYCPKNSRYISKAKLVEEIVPLLESGDIVLGLGAGEINVLIEKLADEFKRSRVTEKC